MSNKFLKEASKNVDDAINNLKSYIKFFDDDDVKNNIIKLYDIKDFIDYLNIGVKITKKTLDFNDLMEE
jgi:hypothetical protein